MRIRADRSLGKQLDSACPINWNYFLNRGLVGEWAVSPLAGWNRSNTFRDLVRGGKNPKDGAINGGVTWQGNSRPGGYGSLKFDGTSGYVDFGTPAKLTDLTQASWAFWIQTPNNASILTKDDNDSSQGWFIRGTPASYDIQFHVVYSSTDLVLVSANNTDSRWHMFIVTWDGTNLHTGSHIYIDGKETAYGTVTNGSGSHNSDVADHFYVGKGSLGFYSGYIDQIGIYNRALSAAEVAALYDQTRRGNPDRWRWISPITFFLPQAPSPPSTVATLRIPRTFNDGKILIAGGQVAGV